MESGEILKVGKTKKEATYAIAVATISMAAEILSVTTECEREKTNQNRRSK